MKRFILLSIMFLSAAKGLTTEEIMWLFKWWHQYYTMKQAGKLNPDFSFSDRLRMPVMKKYLLAAAQLNELVADTFDSRSLEWALNYLKPRSGPASALPDSVRRELLYYFYRDYLTTMDAPWKFKGREGYYLGDFYIHGGKGTYQKGWIRFVDILLTEDPGFYGYITVSWTHCDGTELGPSAAVRTIHRAMEEGKLLSYSVKPVWEYDLSLKPCTLYNSLAFTARLPVEYDYWCYRMHIRYSDSLQVFVFKKNNYRYLISIPRLTYEIWNMSTYEEWIEYNVVLPD